MENFKQKLTEKYLTQFDKYIQTVAEIEYGKIDMPVTQKNHIDVFVKYTDYLVNKSSADLMDTYSIGVFSINPHDNHSEDQILDMTDSILEHKEILFQKGMASCFDSLKKKAGRLYSDEAIKKCVAVNLATRLTLAKDEFEKWTENVHTKSSSLDATNEQEISNAQ